MLKNHQRMKLFYIVLFVVIYGHPVFSQLTLQAPTTSVKTGGTISLPIRVSTKDSLAAMQLTVFWDTAVVQYVGLDSFGLVGMDSTDFGKTNIANGKLTFLWTEPTTYGITLKDTTTIFRFKLRAIGKAGTFSPIQFVGAPTSVKAYNPKSDSIKINRMDGRLNVVTAVPTTDIKSNVSAQLFQNFPNPVTLNTTIPFELQKAGESFLTISDLSGRVVKEEKGFFDTGKNIFKVSLTTDMTSGVYFYTLRTPDGLTTKKLLKN